MFLIYKFEADENKLVSCGTIPGRFLSKAQAKLKITTLDKAFNYEIRHENGFNILQKEDLKIGMEIFIAHPFYGIDHIIVKSLPYMEKNTNSLFIKSELIIKDESFDHTNSLDDAGILEDTYNNRRTFKTLLEAKQYVSYMLTLESTHLDHEIHLNRISMLDDMFPDYEGY